MLPCLRRIQEDRGYVADGDIDELVGYLGVPRIQIEEVLSYYTQFRRKPIGRWHLQVCRNVSCSMRGAERLIDHLERTLGIAPGETTADGRFTLSTVECLGSCGTAPVVMVNETYHENMSAGEDRRAARGARLTCPARQLLMTFPVTATSHTLADYRARGGYATLEKALRAMTPQRDHRGSDGLRAAGPRRRRVPRRPQVVGDQAQRRPAALPLRQRRRGRARHVQGPLDPRARAAPAARVDADRRLRAAGAPRLRLHPRRVRPAVPPPPGRARRGLRRGPLGERILGTDFACDIVVYRGAGSYVCGEASGLITSIEGKRGYPRNRPPRLTVRGLYQKPTVINNVETLANIAGIIAHGAEAFRKVGTAKSPGTQLISISGHIARPGVYEVEYGYPLAKFLYEDCGGILGGREAQVASFPAASRPRC